MRLTSLRLGAGAVPTVLLHGFLGQGKNLRSLAQRWSERDASRLFLLLDLRGHGTSPALSPGLGLEGLARDVLETVEAEGLPFPIDLVGHSLGGRVALAAAEREPSRVRSVALLDIGPSPVPRALSEAGAVLETLRQAPSEAPDRRTLKDWLTGHGLSGPLSDWLLMNVTLEDGRYVWRLDREALAVLHGEVNEQDLWPVVERLRNAVRAIRGGRSPYVSEEEVARFRTMGVDVTTLEGAGHDVHVDALDALVDALAG